MRRPLGTLEHPTARGFGAGPRDVFIFPGFVDLFLFFQRFFLVVFQRSFSFFASMVFSFFFFFSLEGEGRGRVDREK